MSGDCHVTHPISSTISLALVMIEAPVKHTIPAISMEYHLALQDTTKHCPETLS